MSLLIESIKLLDGRFYKLPYHEQRMNHSLFRLFQFSDAVDLETILRRHDYPRIGLHKCRIVYDNKQMEVSFSAYEPRIIRRIKVIEDNEISYSYKFAERGPINRLYERRDACDDVLIIKHGKVTDCSYSNVLFRKGLDWYTSDSPLLEGTMRAKLLRENKIQAREIRKDDIRSYDSLKIVNAMLEFDGPEIDVSDIVF